MIPFHLFLFTFFKKENKGMTLEEYQQSQLSKKMQAQTKDLQYKMRHYL